MRERKNSQQYTEVPWQPTADLATLRYRAKILADIRMFFAERNVLEVETPALSQRTVTDPYLRSFSTCFTIPGQATGITYYLQASPEFAMKRLLAAGSGSIYQLCKAFRDEEIGRWHNPEFTMLEWYRVGFDHHALMQEVEALLHKILGPRTVEYWTYRDLFQHYLQLDPMTCSLKQLQDNLSQADIVGLSLDDRDGHLQCLLTHRIEPELAKKEICFVYDYPPSQAALARIRQDVVNVAERFEVYVRGIELANGFHELCDATEQEQRFQRDNQIRLEQRLSVSSGDERLLEALKSGLPACAGVALGVDRLILLAAEKEALSEVIAFPVDIA